MRNQNIAKVLKEYRKRNHLSVNDVSILLEDRSFTAAPKTIYGWESGQANPSADILLTLCDLYNIINFIDITPRFLPVFAEKFNFEYLRKSHKIPLFSNKLVTPGYCLFRTRSETKPVYFTPLYVT